MEENTSQQDDKKGSLKTLSNLTSGDPQDSGKGIQIERSSPSNLDNQSLADGNKIENFDYCLNVLNRLIRNAGRNNIILKRELIEEVNKIEQEKEELLEKIEDEKKNQGSILSEVQDEEFKETKYYDE